jgi:hypothetical protein
MYVLGRFELLTLEGCLINIKFLKYMDFVPHQIIILTFFVLLQLDICVHLGSFWINNPTQSPQQNDRESKKQNFIMFLKSSADNSFQGKEFQGDKSVGSWCKAPWRGVFPRNPLLSTVGLEVIGDYSIGAMNQEVFAPIHFTAENQEPAFYSQVQIMQDSENQIGEEIRIGSGERIETENSLWTTEYKSTGADFMFQPPIGIPSAPSLEEIQEGPYQPSAAYRG